MKVLDCLKNDVIKIMDNDTAHDFDHVMRVYKNAQKITKKEKANKKLVLSAVLLHDIVSYPKSSKRSKSSSIESAKKSKLILKKYNFTTEEINIISDSIADHSFSQNKTPQTLEGKILQDADRLDALGAIGIARVFCYKWFT
jgi:Predicted HD superfamily hydrolase